MRREEDQVGEEEEEEEDQEGGGGGRGGGRGRPDSLSVRVRISEISPQIRTKTTAFRMQMGSQVPNPSVRWRLQLWLTEEIETSGQGAS